MDFNKIPTLYINSNKIIYNNLEDRQLIPLSVKFVKYQFQDEDDQAIVLLQTDIKLIYCYINSADAIYLSYYNSKEFRDNTHIDTIYTLFIKLMKQCGYKLNSANIVYKEGDIIYCMLKWLHKDNKKIVYNMCSLGDCLILHLITECKLFIVKEVLMQINEEWDILDVRSDNTDE